MRTLISFILLLCLVGICLAVDQVVIQLRSPIYRWAGGKLIGHVEAGARVDSIASKKDYLQASLIGWIPTVSVRGEGPCKTVSATANGAIVYDSVNGTSIGDILPYQRVEMDSVAGEWVRVRVEGWIGRERTFSADGLKADIAPNRTEGKTLDGPENREDLLRHAQMYGSAEISCAVGVVAMLVSGTIYGDQAKEFDKQWEKISGPKPENKFNGYRNRCYITSGVFAACALLFEQQRSHLTRQALTMKPTAYYDGASVGAQLTIRF